MLNSRLLKKKEFVLSEEEYGPIINLYEDHAFNFLIRLYEFITNKKVVEVSSTINFKVKMNLKSNAIFGINDSLYYFWLAHQESTVRHSSETGSSRPSICPKDRIIFSQGPRTESNNKRQQIKRDHPQVYLRTLFKDETKPLRLK